MSFLPRGPLAFPVTFSLVPKIKGMYIAILPLTSANKQKSDSPPAQWCSWLTGVVCPCLSLGVAAVDINLKQSCFSKTIFWEKTSFPVEDGFS